MRARNVRCAGALEAKVLSDKHRSTSVQDVLSWDSDRKKLQLLSRYEVTLERGFYKAFHELQRLQAVRGGQAVPLPAVVDVDVSGANEMALVRETAVEGMGCVELGALWFATWQSPTGRPRVAVGPLTKLKSHRACRQSGRNGTQGARRQGCGHDLAARGE
jgi:hypothetical protein